MFLGHFGVAFGAKRAAPRVSLGWLILAAQFLDLLWPTLLLLGVERVRIQPGASAAGPLVFESYPVSHSLLAVVGWAVLLAAVYFALRRDRRGALVIGLAVVSHWILDALVHLPDLPLYPGGPQRVGLGIWSSLPATLAIEALFFAAGIWLYLRTTRARDGIGRWGFWSLAGFLVIVYAASVTGPPPPDTRAIGWTTESMWLLVPWGYWVDRHRAARV